MLTYILYAVFVLACFVLIVAVLLQPGKADAGALFTSSISSTAFGPRGTQTLLAKITIGAAALFLITALLLSLGVGGSRSVMEGGAADLPTPTPVASPSPAEGQVPPAASPQAEGAAPAASPAADAGASPSPAQAASPQAAASPAATK